MYKRQVLGENENLDEVRHDLTLVDQVPDMGINVSWESGNYEIVNLLGELQQEHLQEEGTLVELRAVLTYGGEEAVHTFYAVSYTHLFVVDPMLATGGSSTAAIQMLKDKGVKRIRFMCIIAAPEGVERMQKEHPDVDLYIGALDDLSLIHI